MVIALNKEADAERDERFILNQITQLSKNMFYESKKNIFQLYIGLHQSIGIIIFSTKQAPAIIA